MINLKSCLSYFNVIEDIFMKYYKIISVFILFIIMQCFQPAQGIANYEATPLDGLIDDISIIKQNTISFEYRILSRSECQRILGRSIIIDHGYRAVQIQLVNKTNKYFSMPESGFSFPIVSYYTVAQQVRFNTTHRMLLWGIVKLLTLGLIWYPGAVDAIESPRANERLMADYVRKTFLVKVVRPFSSINGVLFVSTQHFNPEFYFTLIEQATGERYVLSTKKQVIEIEAA